MQRAIYVEQWHVDYHRSLLAEKDVDFLEIIGKQSGLTLFIGISLEAVTKAFNPTSNPLAASSTLRTAVVDRQRSPPSGDTPSEHNGEGLGDDDLAAIDVDYGIPSTAAPTSSTSQPDVESGKDTESVVEASQLPGQDKGTDAESGNEIEGVDEAGHTPTDTAPALPIWITNPPTPPINPTGHSFAATKRMKEQARREERAAAAAAATAKRPTPSVHSAHGQL